MKHTIKLLLSFFLLLGVSSCDEFLEPNIDGTLTEEDIFKNSYYFTGPLMKSYDAIPKTYDIALDNMTDNAVSNSFSDKYLLASTGAMRPNNNPVDNWTNSYSQLRNINQFMEKMVLDFSKSVPTPVRFFKLGTPQDSIDNINYFFRLKGEAYFARAYWIANLLQLYGGVSVSGDVLGVPLIGNKVFKPGDMANYPRATYKQCVDSIVVACDSAIRFLPAQYKGTDRVVGEAFNGRASGVSAMALKARVLLYAASPAFNTINDVAKWEEAADAAAAAIKAAGGIGTNLSTIEEFYFTKLNDTKFENRDILFRTPIQNNRTYETDNYPQGYYGSASNNPSQNFVDAFPDADGYPITASNTYDPKNPYAKRDPRLNLYVGVNGTAIGPGNSYTLNSYKGGADAYQPSKKTSRTSYYLKKLLRYATVRNVPGQTVGTKRTRVILGLPEMYLTYAEAANEAWGVNSDPNSVGFTAYDVLVKINARYKSSNKYLNDVIGTNQDLFRTYVRNERRLELSFEGHYFFDLRRWLVGTNAEPLNVAVYGMTIEKNGTDFTYTKKLMETKYFASPYLPISYDEIANAPALKQNAGWN